MIFIRNKIDYINKSLKNILCVDDINNFHSLRITPDFVDQMEVHDFWELVYIESGDALITSDDEKIPVFAGDLFFHKPGEVHAIESINNSYIRAYFISFSSASEITKLFDRLKITIRHEQKTMLKKLCDEALTLYDNKPEYEKQSDFYSDKLKINTPTGAQQLFRMHFEELLISVIRLIEDNENVFFYESKEELDSFILKKALDRIKNSIYSNLTINDLCNELNCGRTYLSILFKKKTGDTIMNYYSKLKIEEAKKLIQKEKHSISRISEMLLFSTQYYFSRVFKRIEGITPSEYKAKLKSKNSRSKIH